MHHLFLQYVLACSFSLAVTASALLLVYFVWIRVHVKTAITSLSLRTQFLILVSKLNPVTHLHLLPKLLSMKSTLCLTLR